MGVKSLGRNPVRFWVGFWDLCVVILIVFPLLTGGSWIGRPHFFIELGILGLLALILKKGFRQPLEESLILRLAARIWRGWSTALSRWPSRVLSLCGLLVGLLWSWVSILRHLSLGSFAFDLGIFTNAIWNLTHGNGYHSSVKGGINLFADHQSPLFWCLAPAFRIFPAPETLLVIQAIGLAFGAYPLYFIGRQYLKSPLFLAALPVLYWAYLPIRSASAFDFHPEVLMLPLFLAAVCGLQSLARKHRLAGAVALVLALGAKESAGAVAAGVGLAWILGAGPMGTRAFTRRLGWFVAALGAAVFCLDVLVIPERFFHSRYAYDGLYGQYGGGLAGALLSPFRRPRLFFTQILDVNRRKFLLGTLAPLAFLPLAAPRALVAALPGYLMLFLSAGDHRVDLHFHYAIEPAVGLFWALPAGLARIAESSMENFQARSRRLALWIAFLAMASLGRGEVERIRHYWPGAHSRWVRSELLPAVDPTLPLAASDSLVPHLATREWVHALDSIRMRDGSFVSCVVLDPGVSNWPMEAADFLRLDRELARGDFREIYRCGDVRVYSREGAACLRTIPKCQLPPTKA